MQAILGIILLLVIAWLFSENRRIINWRIIAVGVALPGNHEPSAGVHGDGRRGLIADGARVDQKFGAERIAVGIVLGHKRADAAGRKVGRSCTRIKIHKASEVAREVHISVLVGGYVVAPIAL